MSIFISYTQRDKSLVTPIAEVIRQTFGQESVFFDQWSIQPGDSIIEEMNQGLAKSKFFLYFISKNSLTSEMVKLEWMNALIKKVRGEIKFIPIKIDDCLIPDILLQNMYINLYGYGLEFAVRQIIDVISGKNTYKPGELSGFQNIRAYISGSSKQLKVEFRAEAYTEPHSKYLILLNNEEEDVECSALGNELFMKGFQKNIQLSDGRKGNAYLISRSEATSPNFPFQTELKAKDENSINFIVAMKAVSNDQFSAIPIIFEQPKTHF